VALATFANLKTAVASWLHRTDLTTPIADFVVLCESNIRQDVRCRAMEATATGDLTTTTLAFPTRFAEARRVVLGVQTLQYVTPEEFYPRREFSTGIYTILGDDFVFQSTSGTYAIDYYQWFAPFSADADTNWLLTNHPGVYLWGTLAEAAKFLREDPTVWEAQYATALMKLEKAEASLTGPLVIRPERTA
jgi:hypothetical protein